MEEDNADDILRWLFAEQTMVDYKGNLKLEKNARYIDCEVIFSIGRFIKRDNFLTLLKQRIQIDVKIL